MSLEEQGVLSAAGVLSTLRGRRCWVAGCGGLLGSRLLAACRAVGMQVLGLDCEASADVCGDAASPAVLAAACAALPEPGFIFCCAATHGGDEAAYRATYLELPRALHAACPGAKLIFCSSSSVYGGQGGEVVDETSACCAASLRARVLQQAENAVLSLGGQVARLVPLYAEGRCELLRRFVSREPEVPGADGRWLNYVHAADAARALLFLAASPAVSVVNVCGESFTKGEVYAALARLTGLPRAETTAAGGRRGVSDCRVSAALLRSLGWEAQTAFLLWSAFHRQDWI